MKRPADGATGDPDERRHHLAPARRDLHKAAPSVPPQQPGSTGTGPRSGVEPPGRPTHPPDVDMGHPPPPPIWELPAADLLRQVQRAAAAANPVQWNRAMADIGEALTHLQAEQRRLSALAQEQHQRIGEQQQEMAQQQQQVNALTRQVQLLEGQLNRLQQGRTWTV